MNACASCEAPIRWVLTEQGKRMPIDLDATPDGNLEIVGETRRDDESPTPVVRVLKKGEGDTLPGLDPPPRYRSHFATCPFAARHRK